jgi:hypothetical protein
MATKKLSQQEREFFRLVSRAALSNPFSDERSELDIMIAECPLMPFNRTAGMRFFKMKVRIEKLEKEGRADIGLFSGDDRVMMQSAFLFEIFFFFTKNFDELIARQIKAGESNCAVPFGKDAISLFIKRGFKLMMRAGSLHFFITEKAYYFVDNALYR